MRASVSDIGQPGAPQLPSFVDTFADARRLFVGAGRRFADADDRLAAPPIAAHTSHDGVAHATGGLAPASTGLAGDTTDI
jgi:hypothetical protein